MEFLIAGLLGGIFGALIRIHSELWSISRAIDMFRDDYNFHRKPPKELEFEKKAERSHYE